MGTAKKVPTRRSTTMRTGTMGNTTRAMVERRVQSSRKKANTTKGIAPKVLTAFTRRTSMRRRPNSLKRTTKEATARNMEDLVIRMNIKREDIKKAGTKKEATKKAIMERKQQMLKEVITKTSTVTTAKEGTNTIINMTLNMATSKEPAMERNGDGGRARTVVEAIMEVVTMAVVLIPIKTTLSKQHQRTDKLHTLIKATLFKILHQTTLSLWQNPLTRLTK